MKILVTIFLFSLPLFGCAAAQVSADSEWLKTLFDADQSIRSEENRKAGNTPTLQEERNRRFSVLQAISEGGVQTANDYFHAGMILHHTSSTRLEDGSLASMGTESHLLAFFLFRRADQLGHDHARSLMAAAYNYYLRACGEDAGQYGYKFEGREIIWRPNIDADEVDELKCGFDPRRYVD